MQAFHGTIVLYTFVTSVKSIYNVTRQCSIQVTFTCQLAQLYVIDPLELDLPVLRQAMAFVKDWTTLPESLVKANETLVNSDAIIVISPEYNHSIPPALSNLLDHFPLSSYKYKVSGIVCYSPGPYGGMRAAMQLRCLLGELGTVSVPNIFGIPHASQALNENGEPLNDHMASGAKKLITQVDWYSEALRAKKEKDGIPS
jgi:NAD(P)H-dependent FMN reductase